MATNNSDITLSNSRSVYFSNQYSTNGLYRDLIKGLEALRGGLLFSKNNTTSDRESVYLPKFDKEPSHIYNNRLNRSYLVNYWKRAIQSDTGKVISAPLSIKADDEDLPENYDAWLDNIDLEGKNIDSLCRDQLLKSLYKGVSLVFVDYLEEDKKPFVKEIDIDDVLDFKMNERTGQLSYLSWKDRIVVDTEEAGSSYSNATWEVTPTTWSLSVDDDDTLNKNGEIIRYNKDGRETVTDEIPVSIAYTDKTGTLLANSPYETLAQLTIEHFQVSSDIKNNLFYALTPFLFAKGMPEGFQLSAMSAYQMVTLEDENPEALSNADIKWVQADAAPIREAREQLKDIEGRINSFAVDAAAIRPSGNQTATQSAINSAGSNAALKGFSEVISQHMQRILELMHSYMNTKAPRFSVTVTSDFDISDNNDKAKTAITAAEKGIISPEAATDVMKQNNILSKDYDYEKDHNKDKDNNKDDDKRKEAEEYLDSIDPLLGEENA